jgi:endogenous inhibitor of DNA gyrase (YacG/DUF329 family)
MRKVLALLGPTCDHQVRWPRRGDDGVDRFTCPTCGATVISKVQFGPVSSQAAIEYESSKLDDLLEVTNA